MESGNGKIRVVVADDSRTALLSICGFLEFTGQFQIVGTANDGLQAINQTESSRPELVLTDLCMPYMTGLEAASQLRKSFPELRILIFTELRGHALREECLRVVSSACISAGWRAPLRRDSRPAGGGREPAGVRIDPPMALWYCSSLA